MTTEKTMLDQGGHPVRVTLKSFPFTKRQRFGLWWSGAKDAIRDIFRMPPTHHDEFVQVQHGEPGYDECNYEMQMLSSKAFEFVKDKAVSEHLPTGWNRQTFEIWIANPPYERSVERWPNDESKHAWPGQYCDPGTHLAWEAYQEGMEFRSRKS